MGPKDESARVREFVGHLQQIIAESDMPDGPEQMQMLAKSVDADYDAESPPAPAGALPPEDP